MWVRLNDGMPDDPAVDALSDGAFRLFVASICYCQRELTDGYVSAARVPRLVPKYRPAYVNELVGAGLWLDDLPGGYVIRSFVKWNKTREHWRHEAEKAAKRKAEWAARQAEERDRSDA